MRLIQTAFKPGGWKAKEDTLKLLPGPTVEEYQSSGASKLDNRGKFNLIESINSIILQGRTNIK